MTFAREVAADAAPAADEEPDPAAQPSAAPAEDHPTLSPGRGELLDDQRGGVPDEPEAPPPSASQECFGNNSCAENTPRCPSNDQEKQEVPSDARRARGGMVEESPGAPLVRAQRRCKRCHQPGHRSDACDVDLRDARIADVVASCVRLGLVPAPPPRVLPVKHEGSVCEKAQVGRLAWDRSDPEQDLTDLELGAPLLPEAPTVPRERAPGGGDIEVVECGFCGKLGHTRKRCPALALDVSAAPAVAAALADVIPIRRLTEGRGRTESAAEMRRELAAGPATDYPADVERPRTRGDCGEKRPCPACGVNVNMAIGGLSEDDRPDGADVRKIDRSSPRRIATEREGLNANVAGGLRVRRAQDRDRSGPTEGTDDIVRVPPAPRRVRHARALSVAVDDQSLRESSSRELSAVRRARDIGLSRMEGELQGVPGRDGATAVTGPLDRPDQQQRELRAGKLPVGYAETAAAQQAEFSCPNCRQRVRYAGGVGGADWHWENYDPSASVPRLEPGEDPGYRRALNTCRPCGYISCRHHLLLDVRNGGQSIYLTHDTEDPADLPETCSLDIADRGGVRLDAVGAVMNVSRERARQMEVAGLESVRRRAGDLPDLDEADRRSPMAMLADS